jgi:hypothetical protein
MVLPSSEKQLQVGMQQTLYMPYERVAPGLNKVYAGSHPSRDVLR